MPNAMSRQLLIVSVVFLLACGLSVAALGFRTTRSGDRFDFVRWEIATLPNKWLYALGAPLRDDPSADDAIQRYFALDDRESQEGRQLENTVEAAIEGRIDSVLHGLGIDWPFGLLGVWPPVDVELAGSPRVLVVSPRDRIERIEGETLRPDITAAQAETIEGRLESAHTDESALVVPTGGISTYPAVVSNRDDYLDTVATAAHEWTHHYLSVYPLGRSYFGSDDAKVINETVADLVGDEVAQIVAQRWPATSEPTAAPQPSPTPNAPSTSSVDFDQVMRDLRTDVDGLLAEGHIDDAERRMEEVRQDLAAHGIQIRRINQAYFAWYGTYAARPDSVDPLGSELRQLRTEAGSLRTFLALVRGATSRDDIAALVASTGTPKP
jgi:hypothetical protein